MSAIQERNVWLTLIAMQLIIFGAVITLLSLGTQTDTTNLGVFLAYSAVATAILLLAINIMDLSWQIIWKPHGDNA